MTSHRKQPQFCLQTEIWSHDTPGGWYYEYESWWRYWVNDEYEECEPGSCFCFSWCEACIRSWRSHEDDREACTGGTCGEDPCNEGGRLGRWQPWAETGD